MTHHPKQPTSKELEGLCFSGTIGSSLSLPLQRRIRALRASAVDWKEVIHSIPFHTRRVTADLFLSDAAGRD